MKTTLRPLACLLFAIGFVNGSAIAKPARSEAPVGVTYKGNGFYTLEMDDDNVPVRFNFTPIAEMNLPKREIVADTTPIPIHGLEKRAGVTRSGVAGTLSDIQGADD